MRTIAPSMREFLTWLSEGPHAYDEVVERWGGWCPRNTPWEDARAEGLVRIVRRTVRLTTEGETLLEALRSG